VRAATSACAHEARLRGLELANRALTKTIASDQAELLELRGLTTSFASALEQIKTAISSDQDARLRALEETVSNQDAQLLERFEQTHVLNERLVELEKSTSASDELGASERQIYTELDQLHRDTARLRCPSPSWHERASDQDTRLGKTVDQLSARVDSIVKDMGCVWGQKWRCYHEFENW
jgi:chromosome segregation ATPase